MYSWPMDGEIGWFSGDFDGYDLPTWNLINSAPLFEYVVGGGDLFNAPEPFIEEPLLELDPITAAICMMLNGEDVIAAEAMKVVDSESIQDHLVSEIFYGCEKGLLEKSAIKESFPELPDLKFPSVHVEEPDIEDWSVREQLQNNVSSECQKSIELIQDCSLKTNLDGFQEMVHEDACGIRRANSDGDILTLGKFGSIHGEKFNVYSSFEQLKIWDSKIEEKIEERKEKINRYMRKKTKRNFGRKIKYECRKALADSQLRVRGRFAKTRE